MSDHNTPLAVNTAKKQRCAHECAEISKQHLNLAERRFARNYGLSPSTARLYAHLAGYGGADG